MSAKIYDLDEVRRQTRRVMRYPAYGYVHNHGPDEGPGLGCRERTVNGRLVGDCIRKRNDEPPKPAA